MMHLSKVVWKESKFLHLTIPLVVIYDDCIVNQFLILFVGPDNFLSFFRHNVQYQPCKGHPLHLQTSKWVWVLLSRKILFFFMFLFNSAILQMQHRLAVVRRSFWKWVLFCWYPITIKRPQFNPKTIYVRVLNSNFQALYANLPQVHAQYALVHESSHCMWSKIV